MIFINCISYFYFLLIFHVQYIWTYQCLQCATKVYNHLVTINNLSSPTEDDCNIVEAIHGCYINIDWLADGMSKVYYKTDPDLPYDSISAIIERQVILDKNEYSTRRSIGYSCRSNRTACNTIDDLKRAGISIEFPTDKQIRKFDSLIVPIKTFNGSLCSQFSNTINCPKPDLVHCRQCMSVLQHLDICSTCSREKVTRNYFVYRTTVFLNTASRLERITIGCQKGNNCNSMKNMKRIQRMLTIELDSAKFYRSIASITKSTVILLLTVIFNGWFYLN